MSAKEECIVNGGLSAFILRGGDPKVPGLTFRAVVLWLHVALGTLVVGCLPVKAEVTAAGSGGAAVLWPLPAAMHPAVEQMPAEHESSITAVARHLAERESDPFQRIKALHDYVIRRMRYDEEALALGRWPAQDAQAVFASLRALCTGYAQLLTALGRSVGEEIVTLTGQVRTLSTFPGTALHAWNAARIQGRWYLIDAAWNGGSRRDGRFVGGYGTDYLFTPAPVFAFEHLPADPAWHLLGEPLSERDFVEQPLLPARFAGEGLKLEAVRHTSIGVQLQLANPQDRFVLARPVAPTVGGCTSPTGTVLEIRCDLSSPGRHRLQLFSSDRREGTYLWVGQIDIALPHQKSEGARNAPDTQVGEIE